MGRAGSEEVRLRDDLRRCEKRIAVGAAGKLVAGLKVWSQRRLLRAGSFRLSDEAGLTRSQGTDAVVSVQMPTVWTAPGPAVCRSRDVRERAVLKTVRSFSDGKSGQQCLHPGITRPIDRSRNADLVKQAALETFQVRPPPCVGTPAFRCGRRGAGSAVDEGVAYT